MGSHWRAGYCALLSVLFDNVLHRSVKQICHFVLCITKLKKVVGLPRADKKNGNKRDIF